MPLYRCAYCHRDLGPAPLPRCPHCGRIMLLADSGRAKDAPRKRRKKDRAETPADLVPFSRIGRNPAILGGVILVFIILGTLLTSQFQTRPTDRTLQADPVAQAMREVDVLLTALDRFQRDTGRFPTASEGLVALVQNPGIPGWDGHYVNLIQPDPWKTPYRYTLTEAGPEVRSAGPDRAFGTETDIYSILSE